MKKILFLIISLLSTGAFAKVQPEPSIQAKLAGKNLLTDITPAGDKLVAVGKWGNILVSDSGDNWQQANSPVQSLLTSVFFINDSLGWAVGHDATILHTVDGGNNWQIQQFAPELDKPLLDIIFFDEQHGLAVGAYGMSYRTRDGGKTWRKEFYDSLLFAEDKEYLEELKDTDPEGYLIEAESILPHFNKLFLDGDTIWLVGELGLMAKSDDLGQSWQRLDEIYAGSFFTFSKLNDQYIVAGLRGTVFVSDDAVEWQQIDTMTTASVNDIQIINGQAILLCNAGVWLTYSKSTIEKVVTKEGKSFLAGAMKGQELTIASEAGIYKVSVQ